MSGAVMLFLTPAQVETIICDLVVAIRSNLPGASDDPDALLAQWKKAKATYRARGGATKADMQREARALEAILRQVR